MDGFSRREEFSRKQLPPRGFDQPKETEGVVLDFLQHGHAFQQSRMPVAQILGLSRLTLLEVAPKKEVFLRPHEKVYIGPDKREKIHHIIGRINFNKLTQTAKMELENVISEVVDERESELINFFNTAGPISTRLHKLELVPGIGKKHMWKIIEEREKEPFKSFEDLKKRVSLIPDPKKSIIKRIMDELEGRDKYTLFVR